VTIKNLGIGRATYYTVINKYCNLDRLIADNIQNEAETVTKNI
jgi:hypothetical protein